MERYWMGENNELKTATKEPTKLPILNKKHQVEFFGGGFHRQISFHFKDIFGKENPLSDFAIRFESNYLTTFKAWL